MPVVIPIGGGTSATVTIEIALATEPFGAAPAWTDVSDWVDADIGIDYERGGDGNGQPGPGTCTFVLNNGDGRFTPGKTSGPYGGNVKVRRRVRVSVEHNVTTYRRFTGYISGFALAWPGKVTESAQVRVTCTDLLGVLAATPLRHSHTETVLQSGPVALWPLTERHAPAFDAAAYDQPRLRRLNRAGGGTLRFADTDGRFGSDPDMRTVLVKNGSDSDGNNRIPWTGLAADVDLQDATTAVAFGGWFKWDRSIRADAHLASLQLNSTYTVTLRWDAAAERFLVALYDTGGQVSAFYELTGQDFRDGRWHWVAVLVEPQTPGAGLVEVTMALDSGWRTPLSDAFTITLDPTVQLVVGGAVMPDGSLGYAAPQWAWFSHWAVWTDVAATNLDGARIHEDGRRDIRPDSRRSSDRIEWLLDVVNFPTPDRNLEIGAADVPWSSPSRESALAYARDVADTEHGLFFAGQSGYAEFHARPHRYWAAPAQLVTNPTFEAGITGWSGGLIGGDTITRSHVPQPVHSGHHAMQCDFPAQVNDQAAVFTSVPVVTGQTYLLRGWAWLPSGQCPDLRPGIMYHYVFDRITARDEWVRFEHRWQSTVTGTVQFGLINATGTLYGVGDRFWLDDYRVFSPSSACTLSWHHPDQSWTVDVDSVGNIATVDYHRDGGGTVRQTDRLSRATYGPRRVSASTVASDANAARGLAELLLAERAYPIPRMDEFAWDVLTWPTVVDNDNVLGLDIGDRFTVAGLPPQAPASSADLWVEGIRERIARDEWMVRFRTSPDLGLMPDGHWVLGTSTLDSETILSY